jgi:hypothetical protein
MLKFTDFIDLTEETLLIEQVDGGVVSAVSQAIEKIDNAIADANGELEYKKSTSKSMTFLQRMPAQKRIAFVNSAKALIDSNPDLTPASVAPAKALKSYAFIHKDYPDLKVVVDTKPSGKLSSADPNELMTAAMVVLPNFKEPKTIEEADALIEKAKTIVEAGKVKDYVQKELDAFEKDYINTAQAISAAIGIRNIMGGAANVAYMTGKIWNKDIQKFRRDDYGMKDFNSSDIVFKKGNQWHGISLKKKSRPQESDPTLLNKAFSSIISGKKFEKLKVEVDKQTDEFFNAVIEGAIKDGTINTKEKYKKGTWKKWIGQLDNAYVNSALKGKGSLFQTLAKAIDKHSTDIANAIIQLSLKLSLKDLKKNDFNFALVTGIGNYGVQKGLTVSPADVKDIDTITEKMDRLFTQGKPKFKLDKTKKQAFDADAGAATLSYVLTIGKMPVLTSQIRYKGRFTSQPSYLSFMTNEFKSYLKEK